MFAARVLGALALTCMVASPITASAAPPAQDLINDLSYVAARLRADHPGFVEGLDPSVPAVAGSALREALKEARLARTDADYNRIMGGYAAAFRDPHVSVHLEGEVGSQEAARGPAGALVRLGPSAWMLVLPTFYAGHDAFDSTMAAIARARDELAGEQPALLAIDLRGNGGGSSSPADQVLTALWGPAAPAVLSARRPKASLWRTSEGVIADLGERRERIARRYPESLADFDRLLRGIEAASRRGQPLHRSPLPMAGGGATLKAGPKEVVVVTDGACISACLDFLDRLLEAPDVVHVGEPTGSDTLYTEVQSVELPSGRGAITIPMQRLEGRRRPAHVPYGPSLRLSGEENIAAWLADKVAALPRR